MSPDDQPHLTDDFDLLYVRGHHGWSDLLFYTGKTQIAVGITHIVSDPIEDLCRFCCALLRGDKDAMVQLRDEPGATTLIASINPEQQHVVRLEVWETVNWGGDFRNGKLLLEIDVKLSQMVGLFCRQFDKVRWLYREKSYQRNRGRFPYAAVETLELQMQKKS